LRRRRIVGDADADAAGRAHLAGWALGPRGAARLAVRAGAAVGVGAALRRRRRRIVGDADADAGIRAGFAGRALGPRGAARLAVRARAAIGVGAAPGRGRLHGDAGAVADRDAHGVSRAAGRRVAAADVATLAGAAFVVAMANIGGGRV